ncbi:MAG: hypothetical protein M5U34_36750 [Chloroflexi bacterium]|nr:hypothetical protein [Chloroflexota bacterium]
MISLVVVVTHFFSGNITAVVWYNFFIAVPALLLALFAGFSLDTYIDAQRFRRIVLLFLVLLGFSLILFKI